MAAGVDPRDYYEVGDVILTATYYGRILSMTATTMTLESALGGAPGRSTRWN